MMSSLLDCEDKIGWNPAYRVEILDKENAVYLFSECKKICLQGAVYLLLVPLLLQEAYSADELAAQLSDHISPEMVYFALQKLETKRLIQVVDSSLPRPLAAYCGLLDIDVKTAMQRLGATKVYVQDPGKEVGHVLAERLRSVQIQVVNTINEADLVLVIVKDYLQPEAAHPDVLGPLQILFKPFGSTIWLGPILGREKLVCYPCIVNRIKQNRLEETFIIKQKQLETFFLPVVATLETTLQLALNLAAHELLKWIVTGKNERLEGNIITLDTLDLKIQDHVVPSIAYCPHCRDKQPEKSAEIRLVKRKKDAHYRTLTAEETLKKYAHHVSPLTGFVKYLQSSSQKTQSAIHVYHSGANWAVNGDSMHANISNFRNASAGKGTTELAAKAGSLCESLERLSGVFQGNESRTYATYQELFPHAIHPESLSLFSPYQYKNRDLLNAEAGRFNRIHLEFPDEARIAWTRVWSLTEQCVKWVHTSYCYYQYQSAEGEWVYCADSNGCAAGNCLEEAILQGFFELVERDSIAIWWYNRIRYPEMDLDSFHIPYIQALLEEYAQSDREIHVLDITSDLGIPTCVAISRLKKGPSEKIYLGFGAHLDIGVALLRALTEMNQFFMTEPFWEKEDVFDGSQEKRDRTVVSQWMEQATFENQPYLKGDGMRRAADYQKWKSSDLLEDINQCRKIVESQGYEFLVLDQTREEIGLNVVRVIVPGLRHFWNRFAPGRLYEVPVKMGKLHAPLNESELNPVSMFL